MRKTPIITEYEIHPDPDRLYTGTDRRMPVRAAIVSDLHGRSAADIIKILGMLKPDIILAPGDILELKDRGYPHGISFLMQAASIAPTYYSTGNHDKILSDSEIKTLENAGVSIVGDKTETFTKGAAKLNITGLPSAFRSDGKEDKATTVFNMLSCSGIPENLLLIDRKRLKCFGDLGGCKLLLCHHPEYYDSFVKPLDIDIICSGHAHGGQIRLFGKGIFAPGQGFFPKYTSGVYDGRLVVSRGLVNHSFAPRLFNPTEIVVLTIG